MKKINNVNTGTKEIVSFDVSKVSEKFITSIGRTSNDTKDILQEKLNKKYTKVANLSTSELFLVTPEEAKEIEESYFPLVRTMKYISEELKQNILNASQNTRGIELSETQQTELKDALDSYIPIPIAYSISDRLVYVATEGKTREETRKLFIETFNGSEFTTKSNENGDDVIYTFQDGSEGIFVRSKNSKDWEEFKATRTSDLGIAKMGK